MQTLCQVFPRFPFVRLNFKYNIVTANNIELYIALSLQCTKVIFADSQQNSELYHVKKGVNVKQKESQLSQLSDSLSFLTRYKRWFMRALGKLGI